MSELNAECKPIAATLYCADDVADLPEGANGMSLGCGKPVLAAQLKAEETVLDLGCGCGIDVLLSANRVGSTSRVYGLDIVEEMLTVARDNQGRTDFQNIAFVNGDIEAIPLRSNSVDVIISNCAINLTSDKDAVFREAFRVLKPGGRLAVADVVVRGEIPLQVRANMELWVGCIAGALGDMEYARRLARAGFDAIDVEPTSIYRELRRDALSSAGAEMEAIRSGLEDRFMSAVISARKPIGMPSPH